MPAKDFSVARQVLTRGWGLVLVTDQQQVVALEMDRDLVPPRELEFPVVMESGQNLVPQIALFQDSAPEMALFQESAREMATELESAQKEALDSDHAMALVVCQYCICG